jgi:thiosulfate/3-mercaptopyruvate sulfurtransferase
MFADAGVAPGDTVVAYCHIGQQATALLFAARIAGHPVKLYDGSFTEWEEKKLPIERSAPTRRPESR